MWGLATEKWRPISPTAFHASDSRTETKHWMVVGLVPKHPGETSESLHPCWDWGHTPDREGSTQRGRLLHREAGCCTVQQSRAMGSPSDQHVVPSRQSPDTPTSSPCGPCAVSIVFPCSYLAALLAHAGAAIQPPPLCLASPLIWPSACSRADFTSQNWSLGPGRAGKQDFLTLLCLMLEERSARQNW